MNKKFLNVMLFSVILASTSATFVSCKDYDDDIDNLQGQLDKIASSDQLKASISDMNTAITKAQTEAAAAATAAKTVADAAAANAKDAATAAKAAQDAADAVLAKETANETLINAVQDVANAAKAAAATAQATADQAVAAAKAAADKAQANADAITALAERVKALEEKVAKMDNSEITANLDDLTSQFNDLKKQVTDLIGEYSTMVTSVSLIDSWQNITNVEDREEPTALNFVQAIEKANSFGPNATDKIDFKDGFIRTNSDSLVIRVSPTNAVINKDNIKLINSQGRDLSDFVTIENVKPFTKLITSRSAAPMKTGLYTVVLKLKDGYDADAFEKATTTTVTNGDETSDKSVLYAVAIKNTEAKDGADDRYVVSSYDVPVIATEAEEAYTLDFTANDKPVAEIRNRFIQSEDGSIVKTKEYTWKNSKPAVAAITSGDKPNVIIDTDDNRSLGGNNAKALLPVVKGQPIKIEFNCSVSDVSVPVKGFYVTLDKDNAVESVPSEINAWNSYSYTNLNKLQLGNEGTITVNDLGNVSGDVIGFRVYAVNYDGTLIDPDGRAFYVSVGDAATAQSVQEEWTWKTEKSGPTTAVLKPVAFECPENYDNFVVEESDKFYSPSNSPQGAPVFPSATITKKSATQVSDSIKLNLCGAVSNHLYLLEDNKVYSANVKFYSATGHLLKTVTVSTKKVLPTGFGSLYKPKTNQLVDGVFTAYLTPDSYTKAETGSLDISNAFTGFMEDKNFIVTYTKAEDATYPSSLPNENEPYYKLVNSAANIGKTTKVATVVSYNYGPISSEMGNKNYIVSGTELPAVYNTVFADEQATSVYTWAPTPTTTKAELVYGKDGQFILTSNISIKSQNNGDITINPKFNGTLATLYSKTGEEGKYKLYATAKLYSNSTMTEGSPVEEYFIAKLSEDGSKIEFAVSPSVTTNPTADVPSTLVLTIEDVFGHEFTKTIPVTVKRAK